MFVYINWFKYNDREFSFLRTHSISMSKHNKQKQLSLATWNVVLFITIFFVSFSLLKSLLRKMNETYLQLDRFHRCESSWKNSVVSDVLLLMLNVLYKLLLIFYKQIIVKLFLKEIMKFLIIFQSRYPEHKMSSIQSTLFYLIQSLFKFWCKTILCSDVSWFSKTNFNDGQSWF